MPTGAPGPLNPPAPGGIVRPDLPVREPNFFIVGAPKCGTTALFTYLSSHPGVGLSRDKEPHHYCDDLPGFQWTKTKAAYRAQYEHLDERAVAIGEASPLYLYSRTALPRIRTELPHARIIVMLRPHAEYLRSFHNQVLNNRDETVTDIERAWELQSARRRGRHVPRSCREPALLQYGLVAQLGAQLARALDVFPRDQVLVIPFHRFVTETAAVYGEVLGFLGVDHDGRTEFPKIHEASAMRSGWLGTLIARPPRVLDRLKSLKTAFGLEEHSVLGSLRSWNTVRRSPPTLSARFAREFALELDGDARLLAALTDTPRTDWLSPGA